MTDEFRNNVNKDRSRGPKPDQGKRRCRLGRPGDAEAGDRALCRNAPVGLCALGFDHQRFTAVNDDLLEYLGYTREEFLQLDPADLVAPADQRHFNRRLAEIRNGRREVLRIALQLRCKDARDLKSLVAIRGAPESGCIRIAAMALLDLDAPRERNPVLGRSEQHFHTLVETMAEGLALMDVGGRFVYVNRRLVHMSGYRTEELVGRNVRDFVAAQALAPFEDILAGRCGGPRQPFEIAWAAKDGRRNFSRLSPQPLFDEVGRFCGALIVVTDITAQKIAERTLREREEELQRKNDHLEEINTALQTLVKIREIDKTELEETVVANIHQLADPLLVRLKASGLNERQKSYVAILEANLHEVITPFAQQIATRYLELTPAEVEVANLVKHGRKSKEIASLLNISTRTVEMHRRNIRKKLGLRNKHANLRTFLLSKSTA